MSDVVRSLVTQNSPPQRGGLFSLAIQRDVLAAADGAGFQALGEIPSRDGGSSEYVALYRE